MHHICASGLAARTVLLVLRRFAVAMQAADAMAAALGPEGEAAAMQYFERVVEAYTQAHGGQIDPRRPPGVEELLAWAEANPSAVWGAPADAPWRRRQSRR